MIARVKYFAKGVWVDKYLGQWITTIMIMINVGLGTTVISGGPLRFSAPTYTTLVSYSGHHIWLWGILIMASAMLMATPFRWINVVGLWMAMVWYILWMASFTIAALHYETAAATPIPVYGGLAMICAALLTARIIDKSEE